jgi:hypothetical protein
MSWLEVTAPYFLCFVAWYVAIVALSLWRSKDKRRATESDKRLADVMSQPVSPLLYPALFLAACAGPLLGGGRLSSFMLVMAGGMVALVFGLLWLVHHSGVVSRFNTPPDDAPPPVR